VLGRDGSCDNLVNVSAIAEVEAGGPRIGRDAVPSCTQTRGGARWGGLAVEGPAVGPSCCAAARTSAGYASCWNRLSEVVASVRVWSSSAAASAFFLRYTSALSRFKNQHDLPSAVNDCIRCSSDQPEPSRVVPGAGRFLPRTLYNAPQAPRGARPCVRDMRVLLNSMGKGVHREGHR
jgi:hypothetical protein